MEKSIIFLIFIVVFYVLPALLKKGDRKNYEYPEVPDEPPPAEPGRLAGRKVALSAAAETKVLTESANLPADNSDFAGGTMLFADEAPPVVSVDFSPWQGGLDRTAVLNGVIYAEILRQPRALNKKIR